MMGYSEVAVRLAWSCFFSKDLRPSGERIKSDVLIDNELLEKLLRNEGRSQPEAADMLGITVGRVQNACNWAYHFHWALSLSLSLGTYWVCIRTAWRLEDIITSCGLHCCNIYIRYESTD